MGIEKQNQQSKDWVNRVLSNRIDDVSDLCDEKAECIYRQFMLKLSEAVPSKSPQYYEIENLFIAQIRKVVETAYPLGLRDGMALVSGCRSTDVE